MTPGRCPISVVIPAYQAQPFLQRSVTAVLNQTLLPSEIIIVDDGSTDGTARVAQNLGERVRYLHQENAGAAATRNRGIAAATAEWIAFLDADDSWLPEHLERCWDVICGDPALMWCCGAYRRVTGDGHELRTGDDAWMRLESTRDKSVLFFDAIVGKAPIQTSGLLVSRKLIEVVGVFDPNLRRGQDRDYYYRIALRYPRMGFVWPPTVRYIHTAGSVTARGGDESSRLLEMVSRNVERAHGLESEMYKSFEIILRQLARETMRHSLCMGRPDCLRSLLAEFGWLLSPGQRMMTWCGSHIPASILRRLGIVYQTLRDLNGRV